MGTCNYKPKIMNEKQRKNLISALKSIKKEINSLSFPSRGICQEIYSCGITHENVKLVKKFMNSFNKNTDDFWFKTDRDRVKWLKHQIKSLKLMK